MRAPKIYEDLTPLHEKARNVSRVLGILCVFVLLAFWKVQILDHRTYWKLSEANRVREIVVAPQRGLIRDRHGNILARNVASFKASIIRENCRDFDQACLNVSRILGLPVSVLKERIAKYAHLPAFHPIVIKDDLTLEDVSRILARKAEFPELLIQADPKREYPHGTLAAHVLGYLQEVSREELATVYSGKRRPGDLVGKTGIEQWYEEELVGKEGRVFEVVDSIGRPRETMSRIEPVQGKDLMLTLDMDLQKKAEELLQGREGAVVVLNPRTGEILALASYPTFDPNGFISRFTPKEWTDLTESPEFPLENRAIRGLYAPGSLFKLVVALAALETRTIRDSETYYCTGLTRIYGRPFACWFRGGHGTVNLYSGIRHSCNIYFYNVGKKLGIEEIARFARMLGFGQKTGVDLPGEKEGLVPDPEWKKKTRGEIWYPGETISVSIGQGPLMVTPLQVAVFTATVANRGKKVTPYLLRKQRLESLKEASVNIQDSVFEKIIQGMWAVVNEQGTGRAARVDGMDICGKTGSTQVISRLMAEKLGEEKKIVKTHSWFTGFAPRMNPEVVVTVLVEYGGMGGATAAPLARRLFAFYRDKYD